MLDTPPTESETSSWLYVALAVIVIYGTIPMARVLREAVDQQLGREIFLYATLALAVVLGALACVNLRRRELPLKAYLWLISIFAIFFKLIFDLRAIPEEALHVAEYGLLGLLVYRALTHRVRDYSIYFAGCLVVAMFGIIDEYIQWVVPSRYYDLKDILINFSAGLLTQLAIAAGLRPRLIRARPGAASWSRICFLGAAVVTLLALAYVNTPQRIAWYANQVPGLQFLLNNKSMMAQYGYLHGGPDSGVFRSRFTLEQLRQLDRQRGAEVARILDRYIRGEGYSEFLSIYTINRDPYTHEAGVHLFRREYHFDRARENNDEQMAHYTIAYWENQILSRYFPSAIQQSRYHWDAEVAFEVASRAQTGSPYESKVSSRVITRIDETQVMLIFAAIIMLLLVPGFYLDRRSRDR